MEHVLVLKGTSKADNEVITPNEFTLALRRDKAHVGNLILNEHGVTWHPGKRQSGHHISWDDFRAIMREGITDA